MHEEEPYEESGNTNPVNIEVFRNITHPFLIEGTQLSISRVARMRYSASFNMITVFEAILRSCTGEWASVTKSGVRDQAQNLWYTYDLCHRWLFGLVEITYTFNFYRVMAHLGHQRFW